MAKLRPYPDAYLPHQRNLSDYHVTRNDKLDYCYYDPRRLGGPLSIAALRAAPLGSVRDFIPFPISLIQPQPEDYSNDSNDN
jgi:hypothetical protein